MMTIEQLEKELFEQSEKKQIIYSKNIIPGSKPLIGVKVPSLRLLAKKIAKEDYMWFLDNCPDTFFEFEMLQAFVIGYAKDDINNILHYADIFIPQIHDWAVNDAFCQTFTIARKHRDIVWNWLEQYTTEEGRKNKCGESTSIEFRQRVVAVLLMSHFLVDEYIERVLEMMNRLQCREYYTEMGIAWCVATAYAKYPSQTQRFLEKNELTDWTYNKSIQKMMESFRISDCDKQRLRTMKRKKEDRS